MPFVDEAKIYVRSGRGGKGCVSFRREKYRPKGGPDGGDGGKGGDVVLEASLDLESLLDFSYRKHFQASNGGHGRGKEQHGPDAPDLILKVPLGTLVKDASSEEVLGDLTQAGQRSIVARGGRGGKGNARFATPTRQAPRFATPPEGGEERWLLLELKVLADVGLIGFPNAGKSTLLTRLSAARPKIAPYPFTTLNPHLGVLESAEGDRIVVADIPGLVKGAHRGVGLGVRFLRHVDRTLLLLHVLDMDPNSGQDPLNGFRLLQKEMASFDNHLLQKPRLICLNKMDLPGASERLERVRVGLESLGMEAYPISALTGEGLDALKDALFRTVEPIRAVSELAGTVNDQVRQLW